jgi:hypothetical protein
MEPRKDILQDHVSNNGFILPETISYSMQIDSTPKPQPSTSFSATPLPDNAGPQTQIQYFHSINEALSMITEAQPGIHHMHGGTPNLYNFQEHVKPDLSLGTNGDAFNNNQDLLEASHNTQDGAHAEPGEASHGTAFSLYRDSAYDPPSQLTESPGNHMGSVQLYTPVHTAQSDIGDVPRNNMVDYVISTIKINTTDPFASRMISFGMFMANLERQGYLPPEKERMQFLSYFLSESEKHEGRRAHFL